MFVSSLVTIFSSVGLLVPEYAPLLMDIMESFQQVISKSVQSRTFKIGMLIEDNE